MSADFQRNFINNNISLYDNEIAKFTVLSDYNRLFSNPIFIDMINSNLSNSIDLLAKPGNLQQIPALQQLMQIMPQFQAMIQQFAVAVKQKPDIMSSIFGAIFKPGDNTEITKRLTQLNDEKNQLTSLLEMVNAFNGNTDLNDSKPNQTL